jgi:hypothetical protein
MKKKNQFVLIAALIVIGALFFGHQLGYFAIAGASCISDVTCGTGSTCVDKVCNHGDILMQFTVTNNAGTTSGQIRNLQPTYTTVSAGGKQYTVSFQIFNPNTNRATVIINSEVFYDVAAGETRTFTNALNGVGSFTVNSLTGGCAGTCSVIASTECQSSSNCPAGQYCVSPECKAGVTQAQFTIIESMGHTQSTVVNIGETTNLVVQDKLYIVSFQNYNEATKTATFIVNEEIFDAVNPSLYVFKKVGNTGLFRFDGVGSSATCPNICSSTPRSCAGKVPCLGTDVCSLGGNCLRPGETCYSNADCGATGWTCTNGQCVNLPPPPSVTNCIEYVNMYGDAGPLTMQEAIDECKSINNRNWLKVTAEPANHKYIWVMPDCATATGAANNPVQPPQYWVNWDDATSLDPAGICSETPSGCTMNKDCPLGYFCNLATFTCTNIGTPCTYDNNSCPVGQVCSNDICSPPGSCQVNADCPATDICLAGNCVVSACPPTTSQVCGVDGNTYQNECFARHAGTTVGSQGACAPTGGGGGGGGGGFGEPHALYPYGYGNVNVTRNLTSNKTAIGGSVQFTGTTPAPVNTGLLVTVLAGLGYAVWYFKFRKR